MIGDAEAALWAARFKVAPEQIRRDHLVSHVLAVLPRLCAGDDVVFIGGTALARTHLDGLRVSEDIDLLTTEPTALAERVTEALPRLVRRPYPGLSVGERIRSARAITLGLVTPEVLSIEVQLIRREPAESALDFESRPVTLRYADLPDHVMLTLPTREALVATKLAAYRDRAEPRDLFDLAHLADMGAITSHAAAPLERLSGSRPQLAEFRALPSHTATRWVDRLAHQTGHLITPDQALRAVREAVSELGDGGQGRESSR